ncbi:phosphatase PAP2 family protein [Aureimonas leprariae]|uniref:Phosphatase PAP2 family protein n=1 Tax=Plantimonas leprariae TaxID=2615207 RepID=A0A7V7TXF9_9HYPH|nr:phosphatase PAP2 family protein [Aureimonas leprariae]KAB0680743.1 phosphatase PAP2 family protein [Aureimonas leprariae]
MADIRHIRRLRPRHVVGWTSRFVETPTLIGAFCIAAAAGLFILLAEEVMEGETLALDTRLLLSLRNPADPSDPLGPGWIEEMMRDFTALGGTVVLTLLVLFVAGFLWIDGKRRSLFLVLAATMSGRILSPLLKYGFDRPRPDLVPHGSIVYSTSFPSGHSMAAAITFLTLGALLARVQKGRTMKVYILSVAALLTFCVGISRVYLGVHWPSDVIAGWSVGIAWALGWWLLARWLENRGVVEPEESAAPSAETAK